MTVKSLVVIDGEKIEIKDLKDKEAFADRVNRQVLQSRNYEETGYTYEKNDDNALPSLLPVYHIQQRFPEDLPPAAVPSVPPAAPYAAA